LSRVVSGLEDASREDLLALIGELRAMNASLLARIGEQDERIAVQDKRIAALERAASRNSGNSSMPPSSDDLPGRKAPPGRGGSGGKPGKRPEAPRVLWRPGYPACWWLRGLMSRSFSRLLACSSASSTGWSSGLMC
jgi:Family of unknown function (DUF6444)